MFAGALVGTIGCGLLYTLEIDTSTGKWIGYQVLTGSAIAFSVQNGLNIAQASVDAEDLPAVTANLYCEYTTPWDLGKTDFPGRADGICAVFQTVGGAFTVSSAQAAFINQAIIRLRTSAPDVDAARLIATGASEIRKAFTPEELPGVLVAYMHGLKAAFAVSIAFCGIAFLVTLVVPWSRLPTHAPDAEKGEDAPATESA